MKNFTHKLNTAIHQLVMLGLFAASITLTTGATAATGDSTTYKDSVHQWGAWGLDIEPAAGGLHPQSTQALNARDSKVRPRTNSFAALAPTGPATPAVPAIPATPAMPTITPAIPAVPAIPAITPISPNIPVPVGGPSDGF